ncbi:hypothetical protein HDU79_010659 [Rhizoclosmatium sp. JEL0117]|nr:hypothetical protein HDU79_010659 [Rhizoclosmatium sp. JEL0117]
MSPADPPPLPPTTESESERLLLLGQPIPSLPGSLRHYRIPTRKAVLVLTPFVVVFIGAATFLFGFAKFSSPKASIPNNLLPPIHPLPQPPALPKSARNESFQLHSFNAFVVDVESAHITVHQSCAVKDTMLLSFAPASAPLNVKVSDSVLHIKSSSYRAIDINLCLPKADLLFRSFYLKMGKGSIAWLLRQPLTISETLELRIEQGSILSRTELPGRLIAGSLNISVQGSPGYVDLDAVYIKGNTTIKVEQHSSVSMDQFQTAGSLDVQAEMGELFISRSIIAESAKLANSDRNITLDSLSAKKVSVKSSYGHIRGSVKDYKLLVAKTEYALVELDLTMNIEETRTKVSSESGPIALKVQGFNGAFDAASELGTVLIHGHADTPVIGNPAKGTVGGSSKKGILEASSNMGNVDITFI